eukprot:1145929-Pelagomonas_calceolata.AAC.4
MVSFSSRSFSLLRPTCNQAKRGLHFSKILLSALLFNKAVLFSLTKQCSPIQQSSALLFNKAVLSYSAKQCSSLCKVEHLNHPRNWLKRRRSIEYERMTNA